MSIEYIPHKIYMVINMLDIRIELDRILEEKQMTRYQLAKLTGIQYQTVDKYYKNKVSRYDKDLLLRMCAALDCQVGDLIRLTEE